MDFKMLCPVRATECTDRNEISCSGCGSTRDPVSVFKSLIRTAEMLIHRGIGVTGTDTKYCTTHKTKVTITLAGAIPKHIFDELPDEWQLHQIGEVYYLRCKDELPDSKINDLENWLAAKDVDGMKSVLRLLGYPVGK